MRVTITVTKELGSTWVTDEELRELSDEELLELVQEDVIDFLDGASWAIERKEA